MDYRFVALALEGHRATLVLRRPPLNVLNREMLEELGAALREATDAPGRRVLLVRAEGPAFSAGVDVADHTPERVEGMLEAFHAALVTLLTFPGPTVARVHGPCLGGGLELALACDLIYASSDATLGQPEIQLGAFPPFAAALYPRLLGYRTASELVLRGHRLSAERAAALGLVNAVYPQEELDDRVEEVCRELEGFSGAALAVAKRALLKGLLSDPQKALEETERLYLEELMATEDAREGVTAFLEKRKPEWRDR